MFAPKVAKPQTKAIANSTNTLTRQRSAFVAHPPSYDALEQAHILQRSIGNQATLRLLSQRASNLSGNQPGVDYEQEGTTENITGVLWDFRKIPVFSPDRPSG